MAWFLGTSVPSLPAAVVGTAEEVVVEGPDGCLRGELIRLPSVLNLATVVAGRTLPRWLLRRVSGAVARRID